MPRDFVEERRIQRMREEMQKLHRRLRVPQQVLDLYMQDLLLRFLHTATPKEIVEHRKRFLAEQEAAGNILPPKDDANR
jgi:hypothetical protein